MISLSQELMGLGEQHKEQGTCLWDIIQMFGVRKGSRKIPKMREHSRVCNPGRYIASDE